MIIGAAAEVPRNSGHPPREGGQDDHLLAPGTPTPAVEAAAATVSGPFLGPSTDKSLVLCPQGGCHGSGDGARRGVA
jgi:hypothetical protein